MISTFENFKGVNGWIFMYARSYRESVVANNSCFLSRATEAVVVTSLPYDAMDLS